MFKTVKVGLFFLLFIVIILSLTFTGQLREHWQYMRSGGLTYQGRLGSLTEEEQRWAHIAWRYFQNNTQPNTGLVNAQDNYPIVNLWQIGDTLMATTAARKLGLIAPSEYDQRLTTLLATLNTMPLTGQGLPNQFYHAADAKMVNSALQPGSSGWSASDIGRLMLALQIVKNSYPEYASFIDRTIMRWNFCNLISQQGIPVSGSINNNQVTLQNDLRLGYSEYSSAGYQLWGFKLTQSLAPAYKSAIIYGIPIDFDDRDPRITGVSNAIVSTPYLLSGLEFNWDLPARPNQSLPIDKTSRQRAENLYQVQALRWEKEKVLTARAEFTLNTAPWRVVDTVFGAGYPWNTLDSQGNYQPQLALISTKALFSMWVLWNTTYTDEMMSLGKLVHDEKRGWFEGRYEMSGNYNKNLSLATNAMVLETLFYKQNYGPLLRHNKTESYYDVKQQDMFSPPTHCLP